MIFFLPLFIIYSPWCRSKPVAQKILIFSLYNNGVQNFDFYCILKKKKIQNISERQTGLERHEGE